MGDLNKVIKNTFGTVLALTLIILIVNYIINGCSSTKYPLAEAFSTTATYFTGLAALGAAYIATQLFNDWRDEKIFDLKQRESEKSLITLNSVSFQIVKLKNFKVLFYMLSSNLIFDKKLLNITDTSIKEIVQEMYAGLKVLAKITPDDMLLSIFEEMQIRADAIDEDFRLFQEAYQSYYKTCISVPNLITVKHYQKYNSNTEQILECQIENFNKILEDHDKNHDNSKNQKKFDEQGAELNLKELQSLTESLINTLLNNYNLPE